MKILFLILVGLFFSAHGQESVRGKDLVVCRQLKNSYGYGDTTISTSSKTNAPWKFSVDTVYIDTDGSAHYKKIGTGVVNAGDTSKAIPIHQLAGNTTALGFFSFAGFRSSANDSGAFGIKPLCWSAGSKSWITSKNMSFDYYNSNGDTLITTPIDSAGFGIERYLPTYCDSIKVVVTVKSITGRSSDATKQTSLKRLSLCAY